eukprot:jgi/Bigna1/78913/fgenesh1_pg.58_\
MERPRNAPIANIGFIFLEFWISLPEAILYQFGRIETVAWMSYPCIIELFTTIVCLVLWCSLYATLAFFDSPKGDFYSTHLRNWGLAVAESRRVNLAICATILFSSFGYMMYLLSCMVCCSRVCGASAFNSIEFGTICCCSLGRYSRACWYRLVPCGAACVIFWGVTMAFTGTYAILKGMIKTGRDAIQEYVLDIRPEKYGLINEGSSASCCGCCCPPTHGMSENKHREP